MGLERRHFEAMGTVVSLAAPGGLGADTVAAVQEIFERYESTFSLYRPDSPASRFARGEHAAAALSPVHQRTLELALWWRDRTAGSFTPYRPDGVVDLSGVVKALAIADAGHALTTLGLQNWCVNAGGDVLCRGRREEGTPWIIGVVDPDDASTLLTQHSCSDALPAVATSGTAERGEHVWRVPSAAALIPGQDHGRTFRQVTVAGPDIVTADVLATAILAGGPDTLDRALHEWAGIEVIAATAVGLVATAGFRAPAADGAPHPQH